MSEFITVFPFQAAPEETIDVVFADQVPTMRCTTKYNTKGNFWMLNASQVGAGLTVNGIVLNTGNNCTAQYPVFEDVFGAVVPLGKNGAEGNTFESLGTTVTTFKIPLADIQPQTRDTSFGFDPADYIIKVW